MQNEGNQFSIEQAEAFTAVFQQGAARLKEYDQEFTDRYIRNLSVFSQVMPHIYEELKGYQPKKRFIYLEECGELNLYREDIGVPLFSQTPRLQAREKIAHALEFPTKTLLNLERSTNNESRHVFYSNKMLDEIAVQSKGLEEQKGWPEFVGSAIVFGIEFGYQLELLLDHRDIKHLYLYESDLDFFHYSLFTIEWENILETFNRDGRTVHFFLGVQPEEFTDNYLLQLQENGYFLAPETYLYMSYNSPENDKAFEYFKKHYVRQVMGWGFFDDALIGVAQGLRSLPKTKVAHFQGREALPKWVTEIPVFILGNGPSLDQGIELIKEVRDQVLLICCGSTINTLSKLGITPDIHVDIERMKITADKFSFLAKEYLDKIWGLTVDVMHPEFFDYFKRSGMGMKPGEAITSLILMQARAQGDETTYVQLNYCNPIVANLALSYVHLFGFNNVYYMGVDNGFKDKDSHHSVHSGYYKDGKESGFQSFQDARLVEREGNFGGSIYATGMMDTSRVQLESLTRELNKRRNFVSFNLSDGAKIEGVTPLKAEDVLIMDPKIDHAKVIDLLEKAFFTEPPAAVVNQTPDDLISIEDFRKISQSLQQGWDDSIKTREDVCNLLWSHHRKIFFLRASVHRHIYDLLIGSFTYSSFSIVQFLFTHKDESETVARASHLFDIWCEFLEEMPSMVQRASDFVDQGNDHLITFYNG
ncbi:motility associated factor glycosyltransferase family protein [Marinomonas transparens]|uniref:Motility associated factor glycosyltransferase family protein n=1 Tax=Marinomonas transparens TaxID=2795388 RepID=A0A934JWS0_9GAMM|nr:6-hydroxymethylpterin diphosphokinase MptE-like protein [Marinomonas transparens]MBJ7539811.1 motility associated factor glycosyltransferase family protein [Marinomonas transparens]